MFTETMSANASMVQPDAPGSRQYILKDELAQFCLPHADQDPERKLAWINTVCAAVLLVGIIGIQQPAALLLRLAEEEPQIHEVIDAKAPVPTVPEVEPPKEEETLPELPEAPVLPTVVALNTPEVKFAVPVDGPVQIAATPAVATPPPRVTDRPVEAPRSRIAEPILFRGGRKGGADGYVPDLTVDRLPKDVLKQINERRIDRVRLELSWTVAADGRVLDVKVDKSSILPEFDRILAAWIKEKGTFPATGEEVRYRWPYNVNFN